MRVAVLAAGDGWYVRDLRRAGERVGAETVLVSFPRLRAWVGGSGQRLDGETLLAGDEERGSSGAEEPRRVELNGIDRVLVRMMPGGSLEQVVFRMDALHRLRAAGVPVLNPPAALEACVDKYLATAKLEAAGLAVPETAVCEESGAAIEAFERLGGDCVVKPLFGSEGRGMVRVSDRELAYRTFRALEQIRAVIYLQRFVEHPGWDLRALVLGGRVIAAMRRRSEGDWRTNVARGAKAEAVKLSVDEEGLAIRAAEAVGALAAGVDLLPDREGRMYVLEVNAVPGWRALGRVTGVDVAAEVLGFLVKGF